jgi:hypothetical protein
MMTNAKYAYYVAICEMFLLKKCASSRVFQNYISTIRVIEPIHSDINPSFLFDLHPLS